MFDMALAYSLESQGQTIPQELKGMAGHLAYSLYENEVSVNHILRKVVKDKVRLYDAVYSDFQGMDDKEIIAFLKELTCITPGYTTGRDGLDAMLKIKTLEMSNVEADLSGSASVDISKRTRDLYNNLSLDFDLHEEIARPILVHPLKDDRKDKADEYYLTRTNESGEEYQTELGMPLWNLRRSIQVETKYLLSSIYCMHLTPDKLDAGLSVKKLYPRLVSFLELPAVLREFQIS
jgi:hypothetical protein